MNTTTSHGTVLAVLAVVLALAGASTAVVAAAPGADSVAQDQSAISVGSDTVPANDTTTVAVTADATNVAGYQANLTFDPDVVQVEEVAGTEAFGNPVSNVNNDQGWVFVTESQVDGTDDPMLARITFTAVGANGTSSTLEFVDEETMLNDADSQTIESELRPGSLRVTSGEFVAHNSTDSQAGGTDSQGSAPGTDNGTGDGGSVLAGLGLLELAAGGLVAVGGSVGLGVYFGQRL